MRRSKRLDATAPKAGADRHATNDTTEPTASGGAAAQDEPANTANGADAAPETTVYGDSISQCK